MASSSSSTAAAAAASNMYYNNNHNNNLNAAYRGGSGYHYNNQYATTTAAAPPAVAGPRAKCDQVVFEAITKATEMIIEARCPSRNQQQQQQQQYPATPPPPSSVSARFNLQVPERPEIRQSLQIHRKSLHLPLRLEIYYNRQLLERWCLEYSPQLHSSNNNNNNNTNNTRHHYHNRRAGEDNSIVQLRRVCKKIVVWLRSLYCWIRLLPSHSLMIQQQQQQQPYSSNNNSNAGGIVLDYALEICEASPVPQFRYQTLPPVPTDYGSLQWHVWYNPTEPSSILVSHKNHGASHASSSSFNSRPIPIATKPLLAPNLTTPTTMTNHAGTATTTTTTTTATNTSRSAPVHHDDVGIRDMYFQHQQLQQQQQQQKQHSQSYRHLQAPPLTTAASPPAPPATLSSSPKHHRPCSIDGTRGDYTLSHRAALHDPPPTLDSAYGYAYNNAPMTTTTTTTTTTIAAQSPHSPRLLPGTPPASLTPPLAPLASTPPAFGLGAPLIPPRNNNNNNTTTTGLLAPPFAGLPTKLEDVPRTTATTNTAPFATSATTSTSKLQLQQQQQQQQPPMTSLDLLHSSPFKGGLSSLVDSEFRMSVYYQQQGSADDDYTVDVPAPPQDVVDIDDTDHNNMDDNAVLDKDGDHDDDDDDDDMPFAVDAVVPTDLSLAHKCSASGTKHKKLQLFGSQSQELGSLTQQLHDFKAFGASLHQ